jgi:hypothetical protein
MKVFIFVLAAASVLFFQDVSAYTPKEGNVNAIFGPYIYQTRFPGSSTGAQSSYLGDFAIMALGDVNSSGSLEIAIFHMNKMFFRQKDGQFIAEKTQAMHITMGYRWWHNDWFSTSLAIYSAYGMGVPQTVHSDFPGSTAVTTSARDNTEYGFDFAAQAELGSWRRIAAIVDTRYSFSVTRKPGEYADHYGILFGLRYFIQEKQKESRPKQVQ